jgi:hypoxanthine phosphoribosyltransferase
VAGEQLGVSPELGWQRITAITDRLGGLVADDGLPDVVVGVLQGGMIPAVLLAHAAGLRAVRALDVTHTAADGRDAAKTERPRVRNVGSLGDLRGRDVLVVDDVAGSGDTLAAAVDLVAGAGAGRVRTLVCVVNETNWRAAGNRDPGEVLTYLGGCCQGWVSFPWEQL